MGTPPIFLSGTQRERDMHHSVLVIEGISSSPLPCPVTWRGVAKAYRVDPQNFVLRRGVE